MMHTLKKLNIFQKGPARFPGSETWRSTKCVLAKAETSPSSTTGFAILFAVTLSAILLSIALGVINVALKELKFGTSAKSTNEAFFAADTGMECALLNDKSTIGAFPLEGGVDTEINCVNERIQVSFAGDDTLAQYSFVVTDLGNSGAGCAIVKIIKDSATTTVNSKGYNTGNSSCEPTNPDRIEREVETTY